MITSLPNERLFHHLRGAGRASEVLLQRELREIGLPIAQFYVLACLWQSDGLTQNTIGERTFMTEGVTSLLIKEMIKAGRVEQRRDASDKRKRLIYLLEPAMALKAPALSIWETCLKRVSFGLTDQQLSQFVTLSERMRLNALSAYKSEYGTPNEIHGETLSLIEALTLNTQNSLSVMSSDLRFVYMNDKFRKFFDMPESRLPVGSSAATFYHALANNPRYGIINKAAYVHVRISELRDLNAEQSTVRASAGGAYFRVAQRKLKDGSIITTTERIENAEDAEAEMQGNREKIALNRANMKALLQTTLEAVQTPISSAHAAVQALKATSKNTGKLSEMQRHIGALEAATSTCLLRVEKTLAEIEGKLDDQSTGQ